MVAWEKGMTEDENPDAYAYFSIKDKGNLRTNPDYVAKGSAQHGFNVAYSNFWSTKPDKGGFYKAGTIFAGGKDAKKRRIIYDIKTKKWQPQVHTSLSGTWIWSSDSAILGGLIPYADKTLFQRWLYPTRKVRK